MKSGLLWYDADPKKPIWDKINEAAQRYYEKFGVRPNTCFVNPGALPNGAESKSAVPAPRMQVAAKPTILPNHIWLGVSEQK